MGRWLGCLHGSVAGVGEWLSIPIEVGGGYKVRPSGGG